MERRKPRKRILIIDDDQEYLKWVAAALNNDYIIIKAISWEEANKKILEFKKPTVIIINIRLKDSKTAGLEFAHACRELYPEVGIIIISSQSRGFNLLNYNADAHLEKAISSNHARHLKVTIKNIDYQKKIPLKLRRRRFELLRGLSGKYSIIDASRSAFEDEYGGKVESFRGACAEDHEKLKWVTYRLFEHKENFFTIGIASAIGCKRSCIFCLHGQCKSGRELFEREIMAQVLHGLDSNFAQGVFEEDSPLILCVSFTACGDMLVDNLDNGASAIAQYSEIEELAIETIITSVGSREALRRYFAEYLRLPRVKFYWSINFLNQGIRDYWMPESAYEPIDEQVELWAGLSHEIGEKITASCMVLRGVNDDAEEFMKGLKIFRGYEKYFNFKFQAYTRPDHPKALNRGMVPSAQSILKLHKIAEDCGFESRIRKVIGWEILASCGATIAED